MSSFLTDFAGQLARLVDSGKVAVCLANHAITLRTEGNRYVMRNSATGAEHTLEITCTNPERLQAHWQGFIANTIKG